MSLTDIDNHIHDTMRKIMFSCTLESEVQDDKIRATFNGKPFIVTLKNKQVYVERLETRFPVSFIAFCQHFQDSLKKLNFKI